jgi:hypothetical protein
MTEKEGQKKDRDSSLRSRMTQGKKMTERRRKDRDSSLRRLRSRMTQRKKMTERK